jgi:hypothetical protein
MERIPAGDLYPGDYVKDDQARGGRMLITNVALSKERPGQITLYAENGESQTFGMLEELTAERGPGGVKDVAGESDRAAHRDFATIDLAWARRVLAESGLDLATQVIAAVATLREADRKQRTLRGYRLIVERLKREAANDLATVWAVWQLNETTGERTLYNVFTAERNARDYIDDNRDSFDDTCLYIKESRLTPA